MNNEADKKGDDIKGSADEPHLGIADKYHNVKFIDSAKTNEAVDKIVKDESNELLRAHDDIIKRNFDPPAKNKTIPQKIKHLAKKWWRNKKIRYSTFGVTALAFVILLIVPSTRYGMINIAGVRVESNMTVVDSNTGLPLKNIKVTLQDKESISNEDGFVSFGSLKLGRTKITIDKIGYAKYDKNITLGWGSNPLGSVPLSATGTQFTFILSDWLSSKTITASEATSGENTAKSDNDGKITLIVGVLEEDTEVTLKSDGYRDEVIKLSEVNSEEYKVKMVPYKKHIFVSNRSGEYDLFKTDVDGENEEVLLAATGKEREIPFVLPHQTKDFAAYISSRSGEVNKDNFVLDGLFIVDINTGSALKIARSEQLQLIGWSGDKIIYVAVIEGVSAGNSQRSRIFSYDVISGDKVELAASNYFNDVKLVNDAVYYGISSYAVPKSAAKLFTVKPDGTDKKKVVDEQVWSIVRADYETLLFNAINLQWFEQKLSASAVKLDQVPATRQNRHYVDSPNNELSLWVDTRDGKGVLIKYDISSKTDEVIQTKSGLSSPVYWLTDKHVVFRVSTADETADYILNIDGGLSRKISDVLGNRSRYFY